MWLRSTVPKSSVGAVNGDAHAPPKVILDAARAESEFTTSVTASLLFSAVHAKVTVQVEATAIGPAVQLSSSIAKSAASAPSSARLPIVSGPVPSETIVRSFVPVPVAGTSGNAWTSVNARAEYGTAFWNRRSATAEVIHGPHEPSTCAA